MLLAHRLLARRAIDLRARHVDEPLKGSLAQELAERRGDVDVDAECVGRIHERVQEGLCGKVEHQVRALGPAYGTHCAKIARVIPVHRERITMDRLCGGQVGLSAQKERIDDRDVLSPCAEKRIDEVAPDEARSPVTTTLAPFNSTIPNRRGGGQQVLDLPHDPHGPQRVLARH